MVSGLMSCTAEEELFRAIMSPVSKAERFVPNSKICMLYMHCS